MIELRADDGSSDPVPLDVPPPLVPLMDVFRFDPDTLTTVDEAEEEAFDPQD